MCVFCEFILVVYILHIFISLQYNTKQYKRGRHKHSSSADSVSRKPTAANLKCNRVVNDKPFCKTAVLKTCVRRVDLHVLQNMSSGHHLLSAFRFLSYPIKIIKVIIHKHKISKSKDKKVCRDWGSNLQLQNFGTEVYDLTTAPAQL